MEVVEVVEVMQAWSRRGLEAWRLWRSVGDVWRSGGRVGMEVWWFGGCAGIAGRELWRRQEALKAVEACGGQRLWRRPKAPEAASTKLWRRQEALEKVEGSGGGRRLGGGKHEALEAAGSSGGGRRVWRRSKGVEEIRDSGKSFEARGGRVVNEVDSYCTIFFAPRL
jgi:hypothetical protein